MVARPFLAVALGACTHSAATVADVPIAFGRWGPPGGQSCYVDELQPPELPALSALLDSGRVVSELRAHPPGEVLIALVFDSSGRTRRAQVIDRRMSAAAAESVGAVIASYLRAPPRNEVWGARLRASTGASAALTLGRRHLCPPALARIEPRAQTSIIVTEREPELVPPPDWIVRGVPEPARRTRSSLEKTGAGMPPRDSANLTVDSSSTSPDVRALGDKVLTLHVLIDTVGTIAHAEMSRAAAAGIDRQRLLTELARYRFHPALEDRVRTPWWIILRIK